MSKITIAIPTNRRVQAQTSECLLKLVARGGYDFHILVAQEGYTIAENRNYIAVQALNNGSDHLLMVDDDMTLEPESLDKLLAVQKDIVGVAYHPRCGTDRLKWIDETHYINLETSEDPKYKEPFQCHATGTGIVLIKCSILREIPRPWFDFKYLPTGQCEKGEDWFFCEKAKEYGFETWTEPRIKVGHLGDVLFNRDGTMTTP